MTAAPGAPESQMCSPPCSSLPEYQLATRHESEDAIRAHGTASSTVLPHAHNLRCTEFLKQSVRKNQEMCVTLLASNCAGRGDNL